MATKNKAPKNKLVGALLQARRLSYTRWSPHMVVLARIRGSVRGLGQYSQAAGIVVVPARPRPLYLLLDAENDDVVPLTGAAAFRKAAEMPQPTRRPDVQEIPWDGLVGLIVGTFQFPEEAVKLLRETILPLFPTQRAARLGLKKVGLEERPFKRVIQRLPRVPKLARKK